MNFTNIIIGLLILSVTSCNTKRNTLKKAENLIVNTTGKFKKDSLFIVDKHLKSTLKDTLINSYNYTLAYGNLLNNKEKNLIITKDHQKTYYFFKNKKWSKYLDYDLGSSFISDSIYDINNDSELDILITTKNRANIITQVLLQNQNKLQSKFNFYNAIFNTEKNTISGYIRQNSPIVQFYKFKWNKANKLDTITWIAYDYSNQKKQFIKSKKQDIFSLDNANKYYIDLPKKEYKILNALPQEYKLLDSLYHQ